MVEGYPAATYYDSEDGLVDATNFFYAGLSNWKLKVNKAAGEGLGLKSAVGKENLLEAWVDNTGNFDVDVQVFFEIRDSVGACVAIIPSSIASLPAGESIKLSGTWTATRTGYYYFTAYSFYSAPPDVSTVTIPDGFSQTIRLRVGMPP